MPKPPRDDEDFVVTIRFPGPVTTKDQEENFKKFKEACNKLAADYKSKVSAVGLDRKLK